MPAVGLADGSIQRLVMDLVDASAVVPTRMRGRIAKPDELGEKLPGLLPVDYACEERVLAEQTHSRVQHHRDQEAGLALGETELRDGSHALFELHQKNSSARRGSAERPSVRALDPP